MDHYQTLGVAKNATPEEIKKAYRRLASIHHPDKGGDTARFQEIQQAYDTVSDQNKRSAYDNPQPHFGGNPFGGSQFDFGDIFSSMFGQNFGHGRRNAGHVRLSLWVSLNDVAQGGKRTVNLGTAQGTSTIEIEIPLGVNDGDNVQYQGLGPGGADLVVQYRVHPHQQWERHGLNLIIEQKVNVWDLIIGGNVTVTSITNAQISAQIPADTQPGTLLRLRGQGLRDRNGQQGDVFIRIMPTLPTRIAPEIKDAIRKHR
jgi:DnaJ-class molecular chaperone